LSANNPRYAAAQKKRDTKEHPEKRLEIKSRQNGGDTGKNRGGNGRNWVIRGHQPKMATEKEGYQRTPMRRDSR